MIEPIKSLSLKTLKILLAFSVFAIFGVQAAYVQVYNTIQKGKVVFTGNSLNLNSLTAAGQSGVFITTDTSLQVAGYPAGTTQLYAQNSSRANLYIPPTATVLYAELIWSGKHSGGAGTLPQASATLNNAVSLVLQMVHIPFRQMALQLVQTEHTTRALPTSLV